MDDSKILDKPLFVIATSANGEQLKQLLFAIESLKAIKNIRIKSAKNFTRSIRNMKM